MLKPNIKYKMTPTDGDIMPKRGGIKPMTTIPVKGPVCGGTKIPVRATGHDKRANTLSGHILVVL